MPDGPAAMLFLIDTRGRHDPPPEPARWHLPRPSRRLVVWPAAAALLLVVGVAVGGVVGSVLLVAWLAVVCAGATAAIPSGDGLGDHRQ